MKTFAVINQKGGVGKTTTVANFGAGLARMGHGVCLVDLDPQGHLTLHFDIGELEDKTSSIYDVLVGESTVADAAIKIDKHLCLLPATTDLAGAVIELPQREEWEFQMRDGLAAAKELSHEFVLIDCPPSLGVLTLNALAAADEVLIPIQPNFLAMQGLAKLLQTVQFVQQNLNPNLRVGGIIFCMHESQTKHGRDVAEEISSFFDPANSAGTPWEGAHVFRATIRRNVRLAECPSYGTTIFDYDVNSNGARDYQLLVEEFLVRQQKLASEGPAPVAACEEPGELPASVAAELADAAVTPPSPSADHHDPDVRTS